MPDLLADSALAGLPASHIGWEMKFEQGEKSMNSTSETVISKVHSTGDGNLVTEWVTSG
jgi:hypothetical protein